MQAVGIILLCIVTAVAYGMVHDQVTVRVCVECVEYFTIGHPRLFDTESPTMLGFLWGVVGTWWVGLLLGVPLALAARFGARPKCDARSLVKPICAVLLIAGLCSLIAGLIGRMAANAGAVVLTEPLASEVPTDRHVAFIAALWSHTSSYLVAAAGGLALIVAIWKSRGRTVEVTEPGA